MARPGALQFLRRGVILAGSVFPRFVSTWNWLVNAFDTMCGDQDLNQQNGYISVDRTDPDTPVIRFNAGKLADLVDKSCGRFEIAKEGSSNTYAYPYYNVGGRTYECDNATINKDDGIDALVITMSGTTPTAGIVHYNSFSAMQSDQADAEKYIVPLYSFKDEEIVCDFRIGPDCSAFEFSTT